nr:MAG TPA: hypothetical protein [Caudoviricetes sp.]
MRLPILLSMPFVLIIKAKVRHGLQWTVIVVCIKFVFFLYFFCSDALQQKEQHEQDKKEE